MTAKEQWLLWDDGVHDPFFNMSVDEVLLEYAPRFGHVLVRIYRWDRPSLSIGSSQLYPEQYGAKYTIVRRPTGGGNVFHDCDLTYTVIAPPDHPIAELNRMESYKVFHEAMLPMLDSFGTHAELKPTETPHVDRATMQCFVSPSRFDVVAPEGEKYAGAAQRRTRNGILHQGSIRLSVCGGDWKKLHTALLTAMQSYFRIEFRPAEIPPELVTRAEEVARVKYRTGERNRAARH